MATLALLLMGPVAAASAAGTFQECVDQAADHGGEPPTCTEVDGGWVASWPDDSVMGADSDGFMALFVLAALAGLAVLVWKVVTARTLATQSGMDPNVATQMVLLTDNGLDATYLAANLRRPAARSAEPAATPPPTPAAQRLGELKGLLDAGLITQAEFDERRAAIIATL
jgi:hypothetical protein